MAIYESPNSVIARFGNAESKQSKKNANPPPVIARRTKRKRVQRSNPQIKHKSPLRHHCETCFADLDLDSAIFAESAKDSAFFV
ncbi:hypothetical protein [Helicobacter sp. 23-1045]